MKTRLSLVQSDQTKRRFARLCKSGKAVSVLAALLLLISIALLSIVPATAQSGGGYDLTWNTIDGGGGASSAGSYTLAGAIGQIDASTALSSGDYSLVGGFWYGVGPPHAPESHLVYLPLVLREAQ